MVTGVGLGKWMCGTIIVLFYFYLVAHSTTSTQHDTSAKFRTQCHICKKIGDRFLQGVENTSKSNFGGGNTHWEEKSLGKFKYSETRLLEIMEKLCDKTDRECHSIVEHNEEVIEEYWNGVFPSNNSIDFYAWFCIDAIKVCCPNGTFGRECRPCPGDPARPCSGNGECNGGGTRGGWGNCDCRSGYKGVLCDQCSQRYFLSHKNDTHIDCRECSSGCESCTSVEHCLICSTGYRLNGLVCSDIDECADSRCSGIHEVCTNSPGSFTCNCETGFVRKHGQCLPRSDTHKGKTDGRKKPNVALPVPPIAVYYTILMIYGILGRLLNGRVLPTTLVTVAAVFFLFRYSSHFDKLR